MVLILRFIFIYNKLNVYDFMFYDVKQLTIMESEDGGQTHMHSVIFLSAYEISTFHSFAEHFLTISSFDL